VKNARLAKIKLIFVQAVISKVYLVKIYLKLNMHVLVYKVIMNKYLNKKEFVIFVIINVKLVIKVNFV